MRRLHPSLGPERTQDSTNTNCGLSNGDKYIREESRRKMGRGNIEGRGYKSERVAREGLLSEKGNLTKNQEEGTKSTLHLVQINSRSSWSLHSCDPEYLQNFSYLLILLPSSITFGGVSRVSSVPWVTQRHKLEPCEHRIWEHFVHWGVRNSALLLNELLFCPPQNPATFPWYQHRSHTRYRLETNSMSA